MKRLVAVIRTTIIVLLFVGQAALPATTRQTGKGATPAANPLMEYGDAVIGRWLADVTWATDYPGVGKKGEKVSGYAVYRWTADGMGIEEEFVAGKVSGRSLAVWDAGAKQIRMFGVNSGGNYSQGTISKQGAKFVGAEAGSLSDGRKVEYKWEITFEDGGNTLISAGATIINGVSNPYRDVFRRVSK